MEARLLHFYRKSGAWELLHSIDKAIPVSSYHIPREPTSIIDIGGNSQDVLVALQSAMEYHGLLGW